MKKNKTYLLPRKKVQETRTQRISILLNGSELRMLDRYCERYGIHNKSRIIRESLMRNILKQFEKDTPTLFD